MNEEAQKLFDELFGNPVNSTMVKIYPNFSKYPVSVQQCLILGKQLSDRCANILRTKNA